MRDWWRWMRAPPEWTSVFAGHRCLLSTRIAGSPSRRFSRITRRSAIAFAGISRGISTCMISRRRAILLSVRKAGPVSLFIAITTKRHSFVFDFVICATGLTFDLKLRPELTGIVDDIALWSDRFTPAPHETHPHLGRLPYLGAHYELLEKKAGLRAVDLAHLRL